MQEAVIEEVDMEGKKEKREEKDETGGQEANSHMQMVTCLSSKNRKISNEIPTEE